ncbi:MAG TPA: hypothetical protein VH092_36315 [Urbifossiella sp.]|jgi:ElaB/YqjD/DUF883 family membrane-anchored ribosome-binding protein|nr:hypothetical protein [Urbifossiella sp.]
MTTEHGTTGPTPEAVQGDMRATRTHLGEGVQALGDKAAGYAHDAADAAGAAYRGTRDVLHAARDATGHALDLRRQVRRYPWLAVGCAAALGFYCGGFARR